VRPHAESKGPFPDVNSLGKFSGERLKKGKGVKKSCQVESLIKPEKKPQDKAFTPKTQNIYVLAGYLSVKRR
jgi:hypothetical protein